MKIVIDARESGTTTGRYVDKLVEHLHSLKPEHEIIVLTKSPRLEFFGQIAPSFRTIKSDYKEFTFTEQLGLWRQVHSLKADLVHFTMTQQPILYRCNKITTIHDLTTVRFNNPSKNLLVYKFKQRVYRYVIKSVAKWSRCVITPSQFVKKDVAVFASIDPRKIAVTYEAAEKIKESAKPVHRLDDKKFIMYVGRPTPHKNLDNLVQAFAILRQDYPDLMLVLAGKSDSNYKRVGELVTKLRLAHSVIFTDFIDDSELRWLYEHTAAYVFPSLSEGFGLPGLEAMAQGAPVVSSNATCLPEVYGPAAHYFDPTSPEEIAKAIDEVLSDSKLKKQLISNGKNQAAKYSWDQTARQTLEIYDLALKP